jgi:hypothetical protein
MHSVIEHPNPVNKNVFNIKNFFASIRKIGKTVSYIGHVKEGRCKPPVAEVTVRLADALGLSEKEEARRLLEAAK